MLPHRKPRNKSKLLLSRLGRYLKFSISEAFGPSSGSTLILVPTMVMVSLLFCCVTIDSASLSILQLRTDHLAADCALLGARSLSQSAFFTSGKLVINQTYAENQVTSYLSSISYPNDYRVSGFYLTSSGSTTTVHILATAHLPIPPPKWLGLNEITLSATSKADEVSGVR